MTFHRFRFNLKAFIFNKFFSFNGYMTLIQMRLDMEKRVLYFVWKNKIRSSFLFTFRGFWESRIFNSLLVCHYGLGSNNFFWITEFLFFWFVNLPSIKISYQRCFIKKIIAFNKHEFLLKLRFLWTVCHKRP